MNNYTYSLGAITFKILLRFFIEKMVDAAFYTYVLTAELKLAEAAVTLYF